MKREILIPEPVSRITAALEDAGFEAFLVGGCVRDLVLEREPKDWDIATNAKPDDVHGVFEHSHYDNEYGTVRVINDDQEDNPAFEVIEVTTYRLEAEYSDGRRPDQVEFSTKLEDDLKRRDFTINALALRVPRENIAHKTLDDVTYVTFNRDVLHETLVDNYGGIEDLEKKMIRTVGNPDERFNEDALRLLRAIRIAIELGFTIEEQTHAAIKRYRKTLKNIAVERIRDEFSRMLLSGNPKSGLEMVRETELLEYIAPELAETFDVKQNQAHAYDLWEHLLRALEAAAKKGWGLELRLAALFHDIGKAPTQRWSEEKNDYTFHGHEVVGERMTRKILERLKYPRETIETVTTLVRWHMFFSDPDEITLSAVRRLIRNVGRDLIWDLMNLRVADRIGTGRPKEEPYRLRKYKSMVEEAMRDPVSVGQLTIDGTKVMKITGMEPGPKVGYILHALLEEVLDDPKKNEGGYLEKRTRELVKLSDDELRTIGEEAKEKKEEEEEKAIEGIRKKYWVE